MSSLTDQSAAETPPVDRQEEVVDLTVDDDSVAPPMKKRKSAKRERIEREFKRYLSSLDTPARFQVQRSFATIVQEKDDIMRLRQHYINQPESDSTTLTRIIDLLSTTLLQLDEAVVEIRSGSASPQEATILASVAQRRTKGVRGRLEGIRQERAVQRLHQQTNDHSRQQLLNDRAYADARSSSMVTPAATTTRSGYRPDVNPPSSNRELLQSALNNVSSPGVLPDMSIIAPGHNYIDGIYAQSQLAQQRTLEQPYSTRVNSLTSYDDDDNSDGQDSSFTRTYDYQSAKNYEGLVDLALTEAEPLDMPPQMNCTPLEHQRQGLGWLMRAEKGPNRGGILADDMGLGKTIQSIALFYANQPKPEPEGSNDYRLVLVVCPLALIATWAEELKTRVQREHHLRTYIHHKGMNTRGFTTRAAEIEQNADVVICTYQGLVNEYKHVLKKKALELESRRNQPLSPLSASSPSPSPSPSQASSSQDYGAFPLYEIKWHRVVLDEAHTIKNKASQMSVAAGELTARYRLALTGTPMQNRIDELFPLVRFLRISPYLHWSEFRKLLPAERSSDFAAYETQKALAAFLSAVMLRRRKDSVINGRKIIDNLPPKHVESVSVKMEDKDEASMYQNFEKKIRDQVDRISRLENLMMSNMLVYLLRLRQAACHPYLIAITQKSASHKIWGNNKFTRDAIKAAMSINPEIRGLALELPGEERICAECDGYATNLPDTHAMSGCGHVLCAECSIDAFEKLDSDDSVLTCPLCNSNYRFLGNLEILDVLENHRPQTAKVALELLLAEQRPRVDRLRQEEEERKRRLNELRMSVSERYNDFSSLDDFDTFFGEDEDSDTSDDIRDNTAKDSESPEERLNSMNEENNHTSNESGSDPETNDSGINVKLQETEESSTVKQEAKQETVDKRQNDFDPTGEVVLLESDDESKEETTEKKVEAADGPDPLEYKLDINEIAKLFKISGIFTDGWRTSTKVDACLDILRMIWREAPDDKVILFTSFTSLIDVLAIPLEAAQIPYAQYTGRMNVHERNSTLDEFKRGRCKVLLASLKAGNVGLTLTQANRVIIVEPFWNPYVEDQAQDRVYRIGQSREVTIYRVRVTDTVEDRIVTLQEGKRAIIEAALDNGMKTRAQGLSRTDIMYALGLRRNPRPVESYLNRPAAPVSEPNQHTSVMLQTLR